MELIPKVLFAELEKMNQAVIRGFNKHFDDGGVDIDFTHIFLANNGYKWSEIEDLDVITDDIIEILDNMDLLPELPQFEFRDPQNGIVRDYIVLSVTKKVIYAYDNNTLTHKQFTINNVGDTYQMIDLCKWIKNFEDFEIKQ